MGLVDIRKPLLGTFMLPDLDVEPTNSDPWKRNYNQPPAWELSPKSFPLVDIRQYLSDPQYNPTNFLKSHGFGLVKHRSAMFEPPYAQEGFKSTQTLLEVYYPEMEDLVKKTTSASQVFITYCIVRGGEPPEIHKMPTGLHPGAQRLEPSETSPKDKPREQSLRDADSPVHITTGHPIRIPHLDYTPLGARQSIRFRNQTIYNAAVKSGVIRAEDKICERHGVSPYKKESDPVIAEQYNQNGRLGPRYAAYSVWRPIKKVGRDPLALAPRMAPPNPDDNLFYRNYHNRAAGHPNLGGDYLKEFAMLGTKGKSFSSKVGGGDSPDLKWYYVSGQETDEVLIIKLVDSAALGDDAQDADAPWHASPDIGPVGNNYPRESIELRVEAFW
jgi:hypothetical protein